MNRSIFTKTFGGLGAGLALLGMTAKADDHGVAYDHSVVYTMDNAAGANHVLVFQQDEHGALHGAGSVSTGGSGTGGGLSDQGSVILSHDGQWLFVCNAGSDEISVFSTAHNQLQLVDKVGSGQNAVHIHENPLGKSRIETIEEPASITFGILATIAEKNIHLAHGSVFP